MTTEVRLTRLGDRQILTMTIDNPVWRSNQVKWLDIPSLIKDLVDILKKTFTIKFPFKIYPLKFGFKRIMYSRRQTKTGFVELEVGWGTLQKVLCDVIQLWCDLNLNQNLIWCAWFWSGTVIRKWWMHCRGPPDPIWQGLFRERLKIYFIIN